MLEQIINASSNPGDLVLDCFAGSGTTLVAAENLSRRWIGIDNSEEAIATTLNRLRFGSRPMGDYVSKKRAPSAQNHLDLFNGESEVAEKLAVGRPVEGFCLYRSVSVESALERDPVFALKDKPAEEKPPQHLQKIIYKALRKRSAYK
jgi:adenine-specific DNA-methyltransferase